ncbi:hypothetical protein HanRHA438_Chr09g0416401 [Helianthus annuus]|nr:hypothetical protein HanRHA438_Chr09g0416401 [Helianthus annuus]
MRVSLQFLDCVLRHDDDFFLKIKLHSKPKSTSYHQEGDSKAKNHQSMNLHYIKRTPSLPLYNFTFKSMLIPQKGQRLDIRNNVCHSRVLTRKQLLVPGPP